MDINSQLFTMDNLPVKISFEGFACLDVLILTKLIITHGGMVLREPDDDTIVLSPPTGHSSMERARFDVKWLHDCIAADEFLDVVVYMLSLSKGVTQIIKEEAHEHSNIEINQSTDVASSSSSLQMSQASTASTSHTPRTPFKEIHVKKEDINNFTVFAEEPKTLEESHPEILSRFFDINTMKDKGGDSNSVVNESLTTTKLSTSYNTDLRMSSTASNWKPKQKKPRMTSSSAHSEERVRQPYSPAESQQMIDYVIENNAIHRGRSKGLWGEAKIEGMFEQPYRSAEALANHFRTHLLYDFQSYTSDPVALAEFEKLRNQSKEGNVRNSYSEEEKKRMIQYLIEKGAIHHLYKGSIWQEMEAAKIFQNPYRSARSLETYFKQYMYHNFKYYTDDPEALMAFKTYFEALKTKKY